MGILQAYPYEVSLDEQKCSPNASDDNQSQEKQFSEHALAIRLMMRIDAVAAHSGFHFSFPSTSYHDFVLAQ